MAELIPIALAYKEINLANHIACIQYAKLGPADPRQPSIKYWEELATQWQVAEGLARTRLCMNCAHYDNSDEVMEAFKQNPPGAQLKASELPVTPKWADIAGMPSAVCSRWAITCSALRTCADWEDPTLDPDNSNVLFKYRGEDSEEE